MKNIFKYSFEIPQFIVDDGELIETEPKIETYTFTLRFKGLDVYEKLTGRALLPDLASMSSFGNAEDFTKNLDMAVIKNIAKASYCKIDGDAFHQNLATAEEFSKTQAYSRIGVDTDFMIALLEMAVDCCMNSKAKGGNNNGKK